MQGKLRQVASYRKQQALLVTTHQLKQEFELHGYAASHSLHLNLSCLTAGISRAILRCEDPCAQHE